LRPQFKYIYSGNIYMDSIIAFADKINKITECAYFVKLSTMPLESFIASQKGFITAVDHWSKLLAKLLIILPSDEHRIPIVENIHDEHGNGDSNKTHTKTFNRFLQSLGCGEALNPNNTYPTTPVINAFISDLSTALSTQDWIFCTAMLAIIEYTYITVSSHIHKYASKYLKEEHIEHYSLHEIMDSKHATDMFQLLCSHYETDKQKIEEGILYGYNSFYKCYTGMQKIDI
jgi:hypothetical protein